jgi:hypothetical protein
LSGSCHFFISHKFTSILIFSLDDNRISPLSSSSSQLYVGVLLQTQPFFITGIDDISSAKSNAFGAMGMFIATFGISLFGIMRTSGEKLEKNEAEGYQLGNVNSRSGDYGASRYD